MTRVVSEYRWILTVTAGLALALLGCGTPTQERQLPTEIAVVEATRDALATRVTELEDKLGDQTRDAPSQPTFTPTAAPPTITPSPTPSPTAIPPSATPVLPQLSLTLLGCSTGVDITHGLGEVTNAFVRVENWGPIDATDVCLHIEANDVGETHPDETRCLASLPARTRIALKLTVDTEYGADTSIAVHLVCDDGVTGQVNSVRCRELDVPLRREVEDRLDLFEPLSQE